MNYHKEAQGLPYDEFLNSDYWKHVRIMVLMRDGKECVICYSSYFLQVHHKTYKHHFDEHLYLEDLETLCRHCHSKTHDVVFDSHPSTTAGDIIKQMIK